MTERSPTVQVRSCQLSQLPTCASPTRRTTSPPGNSKARTRLVLLVASSGQETGPVFDAALYLFDVHLFANA